jgi:hypothetical protein
MARTESESSTAANQAHRLPTVAELRAMSDTELAERHDAQVARSRETGDAVSDIYLAELGRRMVELRDEQMLRILLAVWLTSAVLVITTVVFLVVAL